MRVMSWERERERNRGFQMMFSANFGYPYFSLHAIKINNAVKIKTKTKKKSNCIFQFLFSNVFYSLNVFIDIKGHFWQGFVV